MLPKSNSQENAEDLQNPRWEEEEQVLGIKGTEQGKESCFTVYSGVRYVSPMDVSGVPPWGREQSLSGKLLRREIQISQGGRGEQTRPRKRKAELKAYLAC